MSDNFGPQQPRVLNTTDRSLDNVVFQYRKPPLTSEWNLINQISNEKVQDISRASYPSGWMTVGEILQDWTKPPALPDESNIMTGQVNCSETYDPNSFKLFSKSDNIAVVNGWPIVIQGTSSPDSNNIIRLGTPSGQLYDFVFLEVWRKLVGTNDSIYPYGNVLTNKFPDNEIEWPAIGTETTKRVQIQYRIRAVSINSSVKPTSDGFDIDPIYPIGGRTAGEYQFSSYSFRKYGASDIGLYISGNGSSGDQTILNTVDGYVYAIPMFMVCRRLKWDTVFTASIMRRTFVDKSAQVTGYVLDRPDRAIADVIYKDDIVDFRHQVLSSGKDVESLVNQTVSKLIAGELTTAVKTGFGVDGSVTSSSVGGGTLTKVECLNTSGSIPSIGTGSGTAFTDFKRRAFCNAEYTHDHNVIEIPHTGGSWAEGDIFDPSILLSLTAGSIVTVDGFYNATVGPVTGITPTLPVAPTLFTVGAGSNLIGQSSLWIEFTFKYDSSTAGFKDVPREFLEAGKGMYLPIATRDNDVLIRFNSGGFLLNFGLNPGPNQPDVNTDARDFLRYKGGNYTENSEFGYEMVVHRTTNSSGISVLTLSSGKYNGYYILGVKSVEIATGGVYGTPTSFSAKRDINPISPHNTNSYTIQTLAFSAINNIRITLYVGSKPPVSIGDYSVADSLKFFELSKQGRGVVDTYEVMEVIGTVDNDASGTFWVDTVDKPIIALLTQAVWSSGYVEGQAFAWKVNSTSSDVSVSILTPTNRDLPLLGSSAYTTDKTPTKIKVTIPAAAGHGWGFVRVPVLVHSYVTQAETPYNFFYKTNAYQGLLDSRTEYYGKMVKEGPAIISTQGSGAVTNYTYDTGRATFGSDRSVDGVADERGNLPKWLSYVAPGDCIGQERSSQFYRVLTVDSDTHLTLAENFVNGTLPNESFLPASVNVTNSTIGITQSRAVNEIIRFSNTGGSLPGNLITATDYYVILGGTSIKISTTLGGSPVVFTDQGTGIHTLITMPISAVYKTYRMDVSNGNVSNIVDRLPTRSLTAVSADDLVDYRCYSDKLFSGSISQAATIITAPRQKMQDLMNTLVNDFVLGTSTLSKRGRNNIALTEGKNIIFKLSVPPRPQAIYDAAVTSSSGHAVKVYQMYLFNQSAKSMISGIGIIPGETDLTGRLYLMVVSGETKPVDPNETSLNGFFDRDTVDIYEIVGRPIVKMR